MLKGASESSVMTSQRIGKCILISEKFIYADKVILSCYGVVEFGYVGNMIFRKENIFKPKFD